MTSLAVLKKDLYDGKADIYIFLIHLAMGQKEPGTNQILISIFFNPKKIVSKYTFLAQSSQIRKNEK